jgi:flavin reductase (DIM6/NTAB) family NADH-FMN oxidoreductase RutF
MDLEWDPSKKSVRERYQLLTNCVIPRPIAWVTSLSETGVVNLAPFSYFNAVASNPMALSIAIARQKNGQEKDTALHLGRRGEGVVHLATLEDEANVEASGAFFESDVSEPSVLGLETISSTVVSVPRLKGASVAFEVRLLHRFPIGDLTKAGATELFILEVVCVHLASSLCDHGVLQGKKWFQRGVLSRLGELGYGSLRLSSSSEA